MGKMDEHCRDPKAEIGWAVRGARANRRRKIGEKVRESEGRSWRPSKALEGLCF